jgi:hypothetical protein
MTVKVEMLRTKGQVALAFECSKSEETDIIDAIRTAFFGDHPKTGGYVNGQRYVVKVQVVNDDYESENDTVLPSPLSKGAQQVHLQEV